MEQKKDYSYVTDRIKDVVRVIVVWALAFLYWMTMLLIVSLFLVNVWMVTFKQIVIYSLVLMALTGIPYIVHLYKVRKKEAEIMERLRA